MSTTGGYGYGGGTSYTYGGTGGGTTTYYTPYTPKGGPSRVWFHLLLDDSILEPGDQVTLRGDLDELGSGGPGVPMAQSADDPAVFEVEVELPIGMTETHFSGMFDYRFAIETPDGVVIEEGSIPKSAKEMYAHFYHNCRTNYREPRLKQSNILANDEAFDRLMRREILQLQSGAIGARECLLRVQGIVQGIPGVVRSDVEDLFDQLLKETGRDGQLPAAALLVLTAAVGMFDLSSTERTWVATAPRKTTTYGAATTAGGYYAAKPIPKPQDWCQAVCESLDVLGLLSTDLKAELTIAGKGWLVEGLSEMTERLSAHGRFDWVRAMPVVLDNQGAPDTEVTAKGGHRAVAKNFRSTAQRVLSEVEMTLNIGGQLRTQAQLAGQQEIGRAHV